MIEDLLPIGISRPGFFANGTTYQSKSRWREGNFVRFHEGTIQPIGGWAERALSGDALTGTPTHAVCWQFEDGTPYLAVGTTTGLFVIDNNDTVFNITPASIHAAPYDWDLTTFGAYLIATNSLKGDDDLTIVNTYVWTGDTSTIADQAWTDAVGPRGAYKCFATPERFLVVLRGEDPTAAPARTGVSAAYSERRAYWASQEELADFLATDTNTGGDFDIQTEGRLVTGTASRGQSLIWSDVDLWTMNYIGGELIYSFQNVGRQCGIVGKRAFVNIDKGAFWMGRGKFFVYDGFIRSLPCEVTDAVFGNFNEARANTVWTFANPRYNEITWFYPAAGSQYPNRYVTYNHVENHWVFGEMDRTAGVQQRFRRDVIDEAKPVFLNTDRHLFDHETGNERDSQAWLASGPIELGNGDRLMRIQGIFADEKTVGDVQLRLYGGLAADSLETLYGPYTIGPVTNLRITARQVRIRLEEVNSNSWRVGDARLAVRPAERRGLKPGPVDTVPASIEVIPAAISLISAQHYTFQAIVRNAEGEVLDVPPDGWTSDNIPQVPIDSTGTVTALATPSSAHIHAFLLDPPLTSNLALVEVIGDNVPASLVISPNPSFDITPGENIQMTWIFRNAAGQIILGLTPSTWDSDNLLAALVDGTGMAQGVGSGGITTNVTANYTFGLLSIDSNIVVVTAADPFVTHTFGPGTPYIFTDAFVVTDIGDGHYRALLVAGGGSGGSVDGSGVCGGGGAAGGMLDKTDLTGLPALTLGSHAIAIGAGGPSRHADHTIGLGSVSGEKGGNSTAFGLTAIGGGKGDSNDGSAGGPTSEGGSGGGGPTVLTDFSIPPAGPTNAPYSAHLGTAGQGHDGGRGWDDATPGGGVNYGGGGGGAGTAGADGKPGPGDGGDGALSDISGTSLYYAGGGGGGHMTGGAGASGGLGGGGRGGADSSGRAGSGPNGSGSGGGGGSANTFNDGGPGGHGKIVIRYRVASGIVATGGTREVHDG